jgi:hypothetical protein
VRARRIAVALVAGLALTACAPAAAVPHSRLAARTRASSPHRTLRAKPIPEVLNKDGRRPHAAVIGGQRVTEVDGSVCLYNDLSKCWQSNGTGNQVTIGTSGIANVTFIHWPGGNDEWSFENAAGNCFYVSDSFKLMLTNGRCTGVDSQKFHVGAQALESVKYPAGWILTHSNDSGANVFILTPFSGDWDKWLLAS